MQGETSTPLVVRLRNQDGTFPLLDRVSFRMVKDDIAKTTVIDDAPCEILGLGRISYQPKSSDVANAGRYFCEYICTLPDGGILPTKIIELWIDESITVQAPVIITPVSGTIALQLAATGAIGNMGGSITLTTTSLGTATADGVAAGQVAIAIGATATLSSAASVAGSIAMTFTVLGTPGTASGTIGLNTTASATVLSNPVIGGTIAMTSATPATVLDNGVITSTIPITFAVSGSAVSAVAAIVGTIRIKLEQEPGTIETWIPIYPYGTGSVTANGVVAGTIAMASSASGTVVNYAVVVGTSALAITATGTVTASTPSAYSQFNTALGAHLIEAWDAALGKSLVSGAVDTWTGQKLGVLLTKATTRPTVTATDANFNNQTSITCLTTGDQYVRSANLGSNLYASGSHPYGFAILRARNTTMAFQHLASLTSQADGFYEFVLIANGTDYVGTTRNPSGGPDTGATVTLNTTACLIEWWWQASDDKCRISRDGGTAAVGNAIVGGTGTINNVSIGGVDSITGIEGSDVDVAFVGFCDTQLSSGDRASVLSLSQSIFGTP